jgi:hypothetical protein
MTTYNIFVQSQTENLYVASVIGIPDCVAEGKTEEEAVANAKEALKQRLSQGKVFVVELQGEYSLPEDNPWLKTCGRFKDDPTWDEFQENIAAYRRELDAEEAAREASVTKEAAA